MSVVVSRSCCVGLKAGYEWAFQDASTSLAIFGTPGESTCYFETYFSCRHLASRATYCVLQLHRLLDGCHYFILLHELLRPSRLCLAGANALAVNAHCLITAFVPMSCFSDQGQLKGFTEADLAKLD